MKRETAIRELLDRAAIRDVLIRFAIGVDRRDWDMVTSCFTPDAYLDIPPVFQGEIKQGIPFFCENMMQFESIMHFMGTQIIELDGDKANGETYFIDYHRLNINGKQNRRADYLTGEQFTLNERGSPTDTNIRRNPICQEEKISMSLSLAVVSPGWFAAVTCRKRD